MMKSNVTVIVGTRAELIKMASIMQQLQKAGIPYRFVYLAQHLDTINELLQDFSLLQPDYVIRVKEESDSILRILRWNLILAKELLFHRRNVLPTNHGFVLVHGDTFSAVWGALFAFFTRNKLMHIEAGLRSHNLFHPFPEELNRIIVDQLADVCACSTKESLSTFATTKKKVIDTQANTLLDVVRYVLASPKFQHIENQEPYSVFSIHRVENVYQRSRLLEVIKMVELSSRTTKVLFLMHPVTKQRLEKEGLMDGLIAAGANVVPRMGYTSFLSLLSGAQFVVTDGGSNQEELSYLGVPTLLFRKATERSEGIGKNVLLSQYNFDLITKFIQDYELYRRPFNDSLLQPTEKIVSLLQEELA